MRWVLALLLALPASAQTRYVTGDAADAAVRPRGPALLLMGGGRDVDAAFRWWRPYVAGGDVVVLRTSGRDGYNAYLHETIGGCDSVETLVVTTRAQADGAVVRAALAGAEAVFLAGGDQSTYLRTWRGTAIERGLRAAWKRGAVIGGTSAGLAVLGAQSFAAMRGSVTSAQALADPYGERVTLARGLLTPGPLAGALCDSHFGRRERLGRLAVFLARRATDAGSGLLGIGVDERTALVVGPDGRGAVLGSGEVSLVRLVGAVGRCVKGQPLDGVVLEVARLTAGHTVALPKGTHTLPVRRVRVVRGVLLRD